MHTGNTLHLPFFGDLESIGGDLRSRNVDMPGSNGRCITAVRWHTECLKLESWITCTQSRANISAMLKAGLQVDLSGVHTWHTEFVTSACIEQVLSLARETTRSWHVECKPWILYTEGCTWSISGRSIQHVLRRVYKGFLATGPPGYCLCDWVDLWHEDLCKTGTVVSLITPSNNGFTTDGWVAEGNSDSTADGSCGCYFTLKLASLSNVAKYQTEMHHLTTLPVMTKCKIIWVAKWNCSSYILASNSLPPGPQSLYHLHLANIFLSQ